MKRRIFSALLAVCLVVTALPSFALAAETTPVMVTSASTFTDMPNDYSTSALEAAVKNGLLTGSGDKILPNDSLTRAQMAAIIVRAFGAEEEADLTDYTDVSSAEWFYAYLGKAVQMKVLQGAGTTLRPNAPITRQEAFAVLARALKLTNGTVADLAAFTDKSSVSSWAVGTTAAMVKNGFVHGTNGKLNPLATITRKDFAVLMDNIVKTYVNEAGTVTEAADGSVMINTPDVTLKGVTVKGNLIIGDGVGDGDVTLDNVKVEGAVIVRGGGVNSIVIKGGSSVGKVVVSKVDGKVRVHVEGGSDVEVITIDDGKDDVIVEGEIAKLEVTASQVPVTVQNAKVGEMAVTGDNASVTIDKNSNVTTVTASGAQPTLTVAGTVGTLTASEGAEGAKIEVAKGATVTTVNAAAAGTEISGDGSVKNANITADDVNVGTSGTTVKVEEGVTGATAGDTDLPSGETTTTDGSSSGGGGYTSPYPKNVTITEVPKAGDYLQIASQRQTAARKYSVKLSGSVPVYQSPSSDVEGLFSSLPDGKYYAVLQLNGIIPVGTSTITQTNPALALYDDPSTVDDFIVGVEGVYTKTKDYTKEAAEDYVLLVGPNCGTITVEVTQNDVKTIYSIDCTALAMYLDLDTMTTTFFNTFYNKENTNDKKVQTLVESMRDGGSAPAYVVLTEAELNVFYVKIGACNGTQNNTITIGDQTYNTTPLYLSVGNNRKTYLPVWKIEDGILYVALPYLGVEILPEAGTCIVAGEQRYLIKGYDEAVAENEMTISGAAGVYNQTQNGEAYFNTVGVAGNTVTEISSHYAQAVGVILSVNNEAITNPGDYIFRKDLNNNTVGITTPETDAAQGITVTYAVYGEYSNTEVTLAENSSKSYRLAIPGKGVIDVVFDFNFIPQPQIKSAILHDTRTEGQISDADLVLNLEVGLLNTNNGYGEVMITSTDLQLHQNGENTMGFWVGFAAVAPEGASRMKYAFAATKEGLALSTNAVALDANVDTEGNSGIAFYANLADATPKTWCQVQWYDNDGSAISAPLTYHMDLSGVTLKLTQNATFAADLTLQNNLTVDNNATLTVANGAALAVAEGATLNLGTDGAMANNGTVNVNGTLVISDTEQLAGTAAYTIDGGTLMFGETEYVGGDNAIVKATTPVSIGANENGGYTFTIPSGSTATIQARNSEQYDCYFHGDKDIINVEAGGTLVVAYNLGNNGIINVEGTLTVNEGKTITATTNEANKTVVIGTNAHYPETIFTDGAGSYQWNDTAWAKIDG